MNAEMKKVIENDIQMSTEIINNKKTEKCEDFHMRLLSKYSPIISGFGDNLFSLYYDTDFTATMSNIETMRDKLILFKAAGFENWGQKDDRNDQTSKISITNNNANTNTNSISVTVSFEEVRRNIENMSALPDTEIEEILSKINDLEVIVTSEDRKSKKWEKAKSIIKWVADKGVDVGIALLPLLLHIK